GRAVAGRRGRRVFMRSGGSEDALDADVPHRAVDGVLLHALALVGIDDVRRVEDVAARQHQIEAVVELVVDADVPQLARRVIQDAVVRRGRRIVQSADSILRLPAAVQLEVATADVVADAPGGRLLRRALARAV